VTLFGERYGGSAAYLSVLAIAYYFNAALGFNGLTLKVFGKVWFIVLISVIAAIVNLALNFALVPLYGPLGAAIATASTLVAHNLLKQWGLWRGTGIAFFERQQARVYLTVALAAVVLLVLHELLHPPIWVAVPLAAIASLVVVLMSRNLLRAGQTFPELARFRVIRLILGDHR
jgi:O-antigen/teichoic acid export membrane protein